ncbi:membrane cofactor protein-like isoform X4 [Acanthochromis polyacanthus]|uniref:membrane cofactor protein-like isoform X4 n=1 Tax=Acanthochromis polyacanthus TaxID=80966 RepID=UPI002234AF30|nr:membrane cofactor protein-like isoform X4 [Acanthochromis polyacanthus]
MVASTLLLLSLGLLTAQAQNCSKPVGGPNMDLSDNDILLNTFPDGHKAYFRCDVGYTSAGGSKVIICSAGIWSPVLLKCERKNCGSAGVVDNGEIDYPNGALFSDKAVITCNEGYILVGKREITCGDQGWMDRLPVCEVLKCDPPADIADGKFSPNKESYEYREVVQYSCRNDYTLHGSKSLSCSENGTFTPAPPTCTKVECKDPKIENGMWKEGARPPYRHGSAVTLQCNSGYIMKGAPYLTCDINSLWSPGLPQCTPVECKDPKIENGDRKEGSQPPYRHSSMVTFECNSGYVMKGASIQTCGINGLWSPGLPECKLDDGKGGDGKGDGHNGSDVGKSVGIAFAVLAPIAAVGLFFIYKKKRSRKHKTVKEAPKAGEDVALS